MCRSAACIVIFLCFLSKAYGQSTCPPNLDFEMGDFTNWESFIGYTDVSAGKNRMVLNPSTPFANRHQIISAANNPGLDPYGGFPQLCPYGGNYSVKLGNDGTGAEAESISYTFVVPSTVDTFTFTYFYAVVFEDPQHSHPEQPRFFVTAYEVETGALINCASYDYVSSSALPGFQRSTANNQVLYKGWTPTSLQFAGLGGHKVRLEFRNADCTLGGHFGYSYMDVASACSNILATAPYCIETNSLILDAPFGFQTYTWYNQDFSSVVGSGQSMTLSPPPVTSGVFYVDVIPYPGFGCRDTLQAFVTPLPVPDTPDAKTVINLCQFASSDPLTASVLPGHQLLWYTTATGGMGTNTAPRPPTSVAGVLKYYVSQKAIFGCEGFRREITVNVFQTPIASFNTNTARQCQNGNSFIFTSSSTNLNNPGYIWEFGDGKTDTTSDPFSNYNYTTSGNFTVRLKVTNANTCTAENTRAVTVVPKPTASFTFPTPLCENQTPVVLTDRSTVPQGIANINTWWWDINGNIVHGQSPPATTVNPGPLPVKLVVTTTEGCRSDTNTQILNIHYAPLVAFAVGGQMCNNERVNFTDQSTMPAGSNGDMVSKWYWTFDNSATASTQNLYTFFNAGVHNARLVAESNIGCRSVSTERNFEVFPKPITKLDINDSCVQIPITYLATDLSGDVVQWNWDFGNGFRAGPPSITKTYMIEGDNSLTLVAQTIKGCRDTIPRPFRIFDNDSHAGKDTIAAKFEPVHLDARGEPGMQYVWSPEVGLDHTDIEKPIATLDRDQLYTLYTVTEKGCKRQSQIFIKRYVGPELYVPNAFTPNNDKNNDKLKVFPVGIKSFGYLTVFNRWGQRVFHTTNYHEGWDGNIRGVRAEAGTYVYVTQAVDYRGKPFVRKGTVLLMR